MSWIRSLMAATLCLAVMQAGAQAVQADDDLSSRAMAVMRTRCLRCHSGDGSEGGAFDANDYKSLLVKRDDEPPVIIPSKPEESSIWQRMGIKADMPPKSIPERERPTAEEKEIVKRWIEQGSPAPQVEAARKFVGVVQTLRAMEKYLDQADDNDRPNIRFFTLTHLHNQSPERVSNEILRLYRAALSKGINSLSWKPGIVVPEAIDPEGTVFAVNVADLDWDRDRLWQFVAGRYSYGLAYDESPDEELRKVYMNVCHLCGTKLPAVRADWFVAHALRPPLYHELLQLPTHVQELEKRLGVDTIDNIRREKTLRAGFAKSGVSGQNRLVERHVSNYGAYWPSYDFKEKNDRRSLTKYPLGPVFDDHPYPTLTFDHDGGEIVFNLPNGLQGYFLVDHKGTRIDEGPIDVVNDPLKTSGTPAIVTGLSCMACHKHGVITDFKDEVRNGSAAQGRALITVQRLYAPPEKLAALMKEDQKRFLAPLEKAIGPFFRVGADKNKPIEEFTEPVGEAARLYQLNDLTLEIAAAELGLEQPAELAGAIKANSQLRSRGLGPLMNGGRVKRKDWEERRGTSLMQKTARELDLGSPFNPSLPNQ